VEPTRNVHATLVDLLDRILDKGLVIHADVIVSVNGIPLIGVNLRAAVAGMETMLRYGVMQGWDEKTREWERKHRSKKEMTLSQGEDVVLKMFGSYHHKKGIYAAWRSGYFYLTPKRLYLSHHVSGEILFDVQLERIKGIEIKNESHLTENLKSVLHVVLEGNQVARLHVLEPFKLEAAIKERVESLGYSLKEGTSFQLLQSNKLLCLEER
jgi:hypothetical protein